MDRTLGENHIIVDNKRQFTDGPPGTVIDADFMNQIQEEILTVITNAGLTPNRLDRAQMYQAILQYAASRGQYFRCQYDPMSALHLGLVPRTARELEVSIGEHSETITYFKDFVYISCTAAGVIKKINVLDNSVSTFTGFHTPHGMAFDGTYLWVAQRTPGTIVKVNIDTGIILDTITIGGSPQGICYGGGSMWTGSDAGNAVKRINCATHAVTTITDAVQISNPHCFVFDGRYIWGTNYQAGGDTVFKLDPNTNTVIATIAVGANPDRAIFDGSHLWVSNRGGDSVSKINVVTNVVDATVALVGGDDPIYFGFDGRFIWCSKEGADTVVRIHPYTNDVTHTISVGSFPRGLCFDGVFIWVNHANETFVRKIPVI